MRSSSGQEAPLVCLSCAPSSWPKEEHKSRWGKEKGGANRGYGDGGGGLPGVPRMRLRDTAHPLQPTQRCKKNRPLTAANNAVTALLFVLIGVPSKIRRTSGGQTKD
ncbi:hypothetical protein E2C01_100728 [Portunus trituberculatus]|uniref:Uncharacterized protein n=1 Tax=Portunus trituberculatus TaxID=210409 RepID=A0A5B7KCY7_PORTR|nr:hypothetical protein [Portunus trituberculatus]